MATALEQVREYTGNEYKYGFITDVDEDRVANGLSEDVVRTISAKKDEPSWMTEWRLEAYRRWLTMEEPTWQKPHFPPIDYQGDQLLLGPQGEGGAEIARRGRPRDPQDLRQAGHPDP